MITTDPTATLNAAAAQSLPEAIMMQPMWLQAWVGWLVLVNVAGAFIFVRRTEAKWVLIAMAGNAVLMSWLFAQYGYQRILGLAHVVFWTPLLVYLWRRRREWDLQSLGGKWLSVLFATNLTSLIIDYIDVARYLAGERL